MAKSKQQNKVLAVTKQPQKPATKQLTITEETQTLTYSGPLPPAAELERYNNIIPNGADRIMKMAEEQSKHRQAMERTTIHGENGRANRGQIIAAIIVLAGMGIGTYFILKGLDTQGFIAMFAPLGAVATAFIMGRTQRKRERAEKDEEAKT